MTHRPGGIAFSGLAPFCRCIAAVAVLGLCGCAGPGPDSVSMASQGDVTKVGPKDTGTFPNLNIAPTNAAPQFTAGQKSAKLAALKTQKSASEASGGTIKTVKQSELDKLARNHGNDTLKQIEGKCDPTLDPTCK